MQAKLEQMAGAKFDSCLLNLYRDGGDHMGWHSDNETLYGREPVIGELASFRGVHHVASVLWFRACFVVGVSL